MNVKNLSTLYFTCAGIFLFSLIWHPYLGSFVIKAIPALSMAWLLWSTKVNKVKFMSIGFVFSALGDIALDIDRKAYFIFGLIFFLVAHVLYSISLFYFFKKKNISWGRTGLIVVFAVVMVLVLTPHLGQMLIPVFIYLLAIAVMSISAGNSSFKFSMAFLGAIIFMISDSLIALDKFVFPIPYVGFAIMLTYFLGNYLIGYDIYKRSGELVA